MDILENLIRELQDLLHRLLPNGLGPTGDYVRSVLLTVQERIGLSSVVFAVMAAGGALLVYLGLTSIQRVSLARERGRIEGMTELSSFERLQFKLNQSGLRIRVRERSRFTVFDIDPASAEQWGQALLDWARSQPRA